MDLRAWRRRRRIALASSAGIVGVAVACSIAIWTLADEWRSAFLLWWVPIGALHVLVLLPRRPRRVQQRLAAVEAVVDADATAMLVGVEERQSTWWVGLRAWTTPFLVLVDDAAGYGLWDVRRGEPIEVMRCPWSAVADAVVREGGARVDLEPAAPDVPVIRLVPTSLRDEPPQLMQTPSRALAFAARIRERLHAFDPEAHPRRPRPSDDIDWTGRSAS